MRDYVRKCGFSKVVLGLSGGIDSALVAAIASCASGEENVLGVLMPSPYSSDHSVNDALELAQNLGIATATIADRRFDENLRSHSRRFVCQYNFRHCGGKYSIADSRQFVDGNF